MKRIVIVLLAAMVLAGCSKPTMLETVNDVQAEPVAVTARRIQVVLPPELTAPALQNTDTGELYLCEDYSVTVQTVQAGDLAKTIRNATGMEKENLQIIKTRQGEAKRYQWVGTTGGEKGAQIGRGCILDDGAYHYVLTTLADEAAAEKVQAAWKEIFTSFCLATEREPVSTGS